MSRSKFVVKVEMELSEGEVEALELMAFDAGFDKNLKKTAKELLNNDFQQWVYMKIDDHKRREV